MKNNRRDITGIVLVNKPKGVSSNRVLQQVKRLYHAQKAGHTGNLDPMATGLLPICLGKATRIAQYLLDTDKTYQATMTLGSLTDTADAEGQVIEQQTNLPLLTTSQINQALASFQTTLSQVPPMYSALKYQGKPLYELARQGIEVPRKARTITIHSLQLVDHYSDHITFNVTCSKGTYVRTLAVDIGQWLDRYAYLSALHRTHCGPLAIDQAIDLPSLEQLSQPQRDQWLLSPETPFQHTPIYQIADADFRPFWQYGRLPNTGYDGIVRLYNPSGIFMALGYCQQGVLQYKTIFNHPHSDQSLNHHGP